MGVKAFACCWFDQAHAEAMLGKNVMVSLTYMDKFGYLEAFDQFTGQSLRINNEDGLVVMRADTQQEMNLPPDLAHYQPAEPGDYKLAESDKIVSNPDYLVEWDIYPPDAG